MAVSVFPLADPWQGPSFSPYVKSYSITCWQWYPSHKTCSISWQYTTIGYLCPGSASGGGLPLPLPFGRFTGWVHSNSPHKTLFEPGCFYMSLPSPSKEAFPFLWGYKDLSVQGMWNLWCSSGACCHCPCFWAINSLPPGPAAPHGSATSFGLLGRDVACLLCLLWLRQGSVLMHLPLENQWNQFLPRTAAGCCQCSARAGDRHSMAACCRWLSWKAKDPFCGFF